MGIRIDERWTAAKLEELENRWEDTARAIGAADNCGAAVCLRDLVATARSLLRQMEERDILTPDQ